MAGKLHKKDKPKVPTIYQYAEKMMDEQLALNEIRQSTYDRKMETLKMLSAISDKQLNEVTEYDILTKKDNLYEALREFYNKRETESYSQKYKAEYLFRNGKSHTLCQLVARAARDLRDNPPDIQPEENDISYDFVNKLGKDDSVISESFKTFVGKKYDLLIKGNNSESVELLEKHYSYYSYS